jgi:hypothetical protein
MVAAQVKFTGRFYSQVPGYSYNHFGHLGMELFLDCCHVTHPGRSVISQFRNPNFRSIETSKRKLRSHIDHTCLRVMGMPRMTQLYCGQKEEILCCCVYVRTRYERTYRQPQPQDLGSFGTFPSSISNIEGEAIRSF